jgi:aminoglycoside phosphotransferase (APT) family kinase protein
MVIDRQQAFGGTTAGDLPVAPVLDFLRGAIPGCAGPLAIERFKGGQSNPTYLLTLADRQFVLRRKPFGRLLPSAHAIEREFEITRALSATGFPVAKPLALCLDAEVIGAPFYVMEHVEGRVFWEPHAPGLAPGERAQLFDHMNATIAKLHGIDVAGAGLSHYGRPEGYVRRQLRRWSEQYRSSATETIAEMDRLMAWLDAAAPPDSGHAIVHGDFRMDNCIFASAEPAVVAVLDWELSTLGDPLADFTYHLMQWYMPRSSAGAGVGSLLERDDVPGVPTPRSYVEDYCRRTGRAQLPALNFYLAFNFFRLAAIFQGILGRVRAGTSANAEAARMADQVRPLAEAGWAFARKAGA